jgi:ribonuclease PH
MVTNDVGGGDDGTRSTRLNAASLALLAAAVAGGVAVVDGGVTGLARPGVVLGAVLLLGGLVAVPALLR